MAIGFVAGDVNLTQGPLPAVPRSAYLEQVRRIAPRDPPGLRDRDAELEELARFCLDPEGASYAWWRAGPWAGKSALLSTFVLRPPPQVAGQVRIVSFFITARLAAQDTREAFTEVLLEQLAVLLKEPLPAVLPEATRDAYLLGLMSQAAAACQEAGGRLLLVVDGLDEDRGVTTGPDAHSIAGLLPADPLAGMRVIVAGRPNPPVPDDVPDWHPLRDPAIIRPLADSPHARDVQRLSRQELQRLLRGSPAEQDVLGLLVSARGGLTAPDLADLADVTLWQVEDILHTTAGRTLQSRPSLLNQASRPEVYLVGHEELQAAATNYLSDRLPGYRDRLHSWATEWRGRQWPAETPEYLLAGYFQLLEDTGDLPRMTELAVDLLRHDRMLDLTGGDAAALAEARTTLDRIAARDDPDAASALSLACHRDHLVGRNAGIPEHLPGVWATLGQVPRAEALARSITGPVEQANALAEVAEVLARTGQHAQAEAVARLIADPARQARALAKVAKALAGAGQHQQAEAATRPITDPDRQTGALAEVAEALAGAEAGQHAQAEAIARSFDDPYRQALALAQVAVALAQAGQHRQAEAIAAQAGAAARFITMPSWAGFTDEYWQEWGLAQVAAVLGRGGQYRQAEVIARSIAHPGWRADALVEVAGALARAGQHQQAAAIATQAEVIARSITDERSELWALTQVAGALARAGQFQQGEAVACSITEPHWQGNALTQVTEALARAGQYQDAEALACSITHPEWQGHALALVAGALARAGQFQQGEALARSIDDQEWEARALAEVAAALAGAGQRAQAEAIAKQAEATARSVWEPNARALALAQVAGALAGAGKHKRAAAAAARAAAAIRSFYPDPRWQGELLVEVAAVLARAGQHQDAEALARSITHPETQASALVEVAGALARAGQHRAAEDLAWSITHQHARARALAQVARALAEAGQRQQAVAVATRAEALARSTTHPETQASAVAIAAQAAASARSLNHPETQARALAQIAEALARAGETSLASRLAVASCVAGPWLTAVEPVLPLAPSAYAALARTLNEQP